MIKDLSRIDKLLKNETVLNWKGFKWSNSLCLDKYHILRLLTQICTLSRYTHTALYLEYKGKSFIAQETIKGFTVESIDRNWLIAQIAENKCDLFEYENKKFSNSFNKKVNEMLIKCCNTGESQYFGKYSIKNLINQIPLNFFNKSWFCKQTNQESMICSESVHYYFTNLNISYMFSPQDIADLDFSYKKLI